MSDYKIINIKYSCRLSCGLSFEQIEGCFPFFSSHAGLGRIVFRHKNFTFCLMGRKNTFLNVTGMKSFDGVMESINCFENFFQSTKILFPTFKFDSICALHTTSPKIIHTVLSPKNTLFWVKRYCNILSRVNIKPRPAIGYSSGMSANVFKSGKCIIFGASNLKDLTTFICLINKSIWRSMKRSEAAQTN